MTAEQQVIAAVMEELKRQADESGGALKVVVDRKNDRALVNGSVDVAALAMVAAGSLAGGP
jgi:hypothetical protein